MAGAMDSMGLKRTLDVGSPGIQVGPASWFRNIKRNEQISAILATPNAAPPSLLASPKATMSRSRSSNLANRWTATTTIKKVSAKEAMHNVCSDHVT